ncbi:MAG TPA: hypothetical protein VGW12_08090 [Pyrinomonadaceae bacterium]|nr:hypothetical protein [Pyrinomonadaceae bacterium]
MKTLKTFPHFSPNALAKFSLLSLMLLCALAHDTAAQAQPAARRTPPPRATAKPSPVPATNVQPPAIPARPVADKLAPEGWTRYEIGQPTRFSLILPGTPSGGTERMTLTPKVSVTVRNYMSLGNSGLYGATYIDDLPADVMNAAMKRTFFEHFVKGFAEGFEQGMKKGGSTAQMKMLELRPATVSGLGGYEQDFTFDKMTGRLRMVYDGARAYAVLSFWSDPTTDADRTAFFDSLRINRGR